MACATQGGQLQCKTPVPDAMQHGSAASLSRDRTKHRAWLRPRLCSVRGTPTLLNPARRQQRACCAAGGDIDEAGMHAGKGLAAFRPYRVMDGRAALGHTTAVRTAETAEQPDVADGVVVIVAQRQRDQRP